MNVTGRESGIQLHITSLPSGRLGREAYRFVDWLAAAGQSWWQVLPLSPPDRYHSPYKAHSAFAAWPGLLGAPRARVTRSELDAFRERQAFWIDDWVGYAGGDALADQVRFDREWRDLRTYATDRGVRLFGDVAIYVAPDSADHRAHPELFQSGRVAGAPPDAYSDLGQLWGNPLYDWGVLARDGYRWWVERLRRTLELFDLARLDHFRGFVSYWSVPEGDRDARRGSWRRGPGLALFDAFAEAGIAAGGPPGPGRPGGPGRPARSGRERALPLVAEDLGVITPPVERLRDQLALPGMLVLQFGFDPRDPRSPHRFANHVENRVIYTGTHDHDTARGWYESLPTNLERAHVDDVIRDAGIEDPEPWWGLIRLALASPGRLAMLQAQDVLGLGSEARMNTPARKGGSWRWQLRAGALTDALAQRLREATEAAGRAS